MLDCGAIYELMLREGVAFFAGVPDSLLKHFCAHVTDNTLPSKHVISPNEGNAVALATGYHLATGELPLVYLQNSGHGNTVNPLISLADSDVYSIPMLLLIGWRGEPGLRDEPQHVKQGRITISLCEATQLPYEILPDTLAEAEETIQRAAASARRNSAPFVLLVRKNTFAPYTPQRLTDNPYGMNREEVLKLLVDRLDPYGIIVATTGKTSRELYEYRVAIGQEPGRDFLTVGCMGHASQIALGIALAKPQRTVYCFDGDGAVIMHMGSMAAIGSRRPTNFKHVVINNGAHDSVGGQPTVGFDIDIPAIAAACGYRHCARASTLNELVTQVRGLESEMGPALLEVRTKCGARKDLGRPQGTPMENKQAFMEFVNS